MYKLPDKLVLDYNTWRCGTKPENKLTSLGKGVTKLRNKDGYKCCLGQFIEQCGIYLKYRLNDLNYPKDYFCVIEGLTEQKSGGIHGFKYLIDTKFSIDCAAINDDKESTISQKVIKLITECSKINRKLYLKNFPQSILDEIHEYHIILNIEPVDNYVLAT